MALFDEVAKLGKASEDAYNWGGWLILKNLFNAKAEMVPDLIWAPDFFGPQEIWSLRNLGPTKVGSCMKMLYNDFHARINFLGAQTSRGPNFLGPKFIGDQISWGPKKSGAQMSSGTISVIILLNEWVAKAQCL